MPLSVDETLDITNQFLSEYHYNFPLKFSVADRAEDIYNKDQLEALHEENDSNSEWEIRIAGAYHPSTGGVVLIASSFRDQEEAVTSLRHEVIGHYGINTFSEPEKRQLLTAITAGRDEPSLKPVWDEVDVLYADSPESIKAEEVFAYIAESHPTSAQPYSSSNSPQTILQSEGHLTRADIEQVVSGIEHEIKNGIRDQQIFPQNDHSQFKLVEEVKMAEIDEFKNEVNALPEPSAGTTSQSKPSENTQTTKTIQSARDVLLNYESANTEARVNAEITAHKGVPMESSPESTMALDAHNHMAVIHHPNGQETGFVTSQDITDYARDHQLTKNDQAILENIHEISFQYRTYSPEQHKEVLAGIDLLQLDSESLAEKDRAAVNDVLENSPSARADIEQMEMDFPASRLTSQEEYQENRAIEMAEEAGIAKATLELDDSMKSRLESMREADSAAARDAMINNSIEPIAIEVDRSISPNQDVNNADNQLVSDEILTPPDDEETRFVIPDDVEASYIKVGNKYYARSRTDEPAFVDKGNKLETTANSDKMAESLVRIAEARGWNEIKITGTQKFRRDVWIEAAARGMEVKGYNPTEQDKVALKIKAGTFEKNTIAEENQDFRAREKTKELQNPAAVAMRNDPLQAAKDHPQLAPAVAGMEAIRKHTAARNLSAEAQRVINARVHQNVVNSIERGNTFETKLVDEQILERNQEKEKGLAR